MTGAVTQVVVLEFDDSLRCALHEVLTLYDHYTIAEFEQGAAAAAYVAAAPHGVVVLVSNRDMDHHMSAAFFAAIVADEQLSRRHRYILLSTDPARMPVALRAHLGYLNAPILAKPFDIDRLLAAVREALACLDPMRTTVHDTNRDSSRHTGREINTQG
jgi:DNA-binding NtrC family response regulator